MKLKLKNIEELKKLCDAYPEYDVQKLREDSIRDPHWLAFGAGNIFRGYIARLNQDLLNKKIATRGISVVESFDEEIIDKVYTEYDNLALSVTLNKDGDFHTNLLANLAEGLKLSQDIDRVQQIVKNKNLQIMSFTITEKGYNIYAPNGEVLDIIKEDINGKPENAKHLMSIVTYLLYLRFKENKGPITLLSLDNCSHNGDKLKTPILSIAKAWYKNNKVEEAFVRYLEDDTCVSFPWSMIDKITPRPSEEIKNYLEQKNFEAMDIVVTGKHTYIAPFVNSEEAEYLVIEDSFAGGRDALEEAGVYLTDRNTVNKVETMKVTTCLNPLHTTLAVYGCLLGYTSIADEMKDAQLVKLIEKIGYEESLPVVVDPKILNPKAFIDEVIRVRLPNPYIPDTPQRIATDTSQKVAIRFGETIKAYAKSESKKPMDLQFIPLAIAGWLRYLMGIDDAGKKFELSPDPLLKDLELYFKDLKLGNVSNNKLDELLSNERIFGINLNKIGLSEKILGYFEELAADYGAVRKTLEKYVR
ncbi:mannitol dehydrogenase family protein [Treponema phagedenis]|uniref:Mannitol dehydrogenase family protein n=1 Tax=Treponema phagedenis TaxID=162 RepID=A0AAE6M5X3_TREPH|nr:mannitol dehydrogenase family protein [Treponema phagedenis]EFW38876.1 mannitol dehydrogenase domain protein [Treponema phagedenis F0421]NVP23915.1 mannitol dehydrogenase family protein [Treponema phagedenis]QEJ96586.1 mannitol dehydrogenase family protein [Treponema phagedenis]QEJ99753.1 mannitol dehydrogenase family protein [Treponema phagedenis]QEK02372.1 mannitol dehydrogenase family protein [Treponema phagedenis]